MGEIPLRRILRQRPLPPAVDPVEPERVPHQKNHQEQGQQKLPQLGIGPLLHRGQLPLGQAAAQAGESNRLIQDAQHRPTHHDQQRQKQRGQELKI